MKATAKAKRHAVAYEGQPYVGWVCFECDEIEEGELDRSTTPCPECGEASLGDGTIAVLETADTWQKATGQIAKDARRKPRGAPRAGKSDASRAAAAEEESRRVKFGDWWGEIGQARRRELLRAHSSHGDGSTSTADAHQTEEENATRQIRAKYEAGEYD